MNKLAESGKYDDEEDHSPMATSSSIFASSTAVLDSSPDVLIGFHVRIAS